MKLRWQTPFSRPLSTDRSETQNKNVHIHVNKINKCLVVIGESDRRSGVVFSENVMMKSSLYLH